MLRGYTTPADRNRPNVPESVPVEPLLRSRLGLDRRFEKNQKERLVRWAIAVDADVSPLDLLAAGKEQLCDADEIAGVDDVAGVPVNGAAGRSLEQEDAAAAKPNRPLEAVRQAETLSSSAAAPSFRALHKRLHPTYRSAIGSLSCKSVLAPSRWAASRKSASLTIA